MSNDTKVIIPSTPSMTGNYPTGGGIGTVTAWTRPDLVIAAPGGIGAFTPANTCSVPATPSPSSRGKT